MSIDEAPCEAFNLMHILELPIDGQNYQSMVISYHMCISRRNHSTEIYFKLQTIRLKLLSIKIDFSLIVILNSM